ncbi:MAG: ABC transporter permease, partial [Chloroflexota bacterium]
GGIGIMNIMLVSVTERTREIGIRKAVGARRKDILSQFLVESVMVSVLGGAIGVILGWGISKMIAGMPMPGASGGQGLQTVVTPESVLLAFGVSAAVGIFFGIYPASRAARLHPIQALRYE